MTESGKKRFVTVQKLQDEAQSHFEKGEFEAAEESIEEAIRLAGRVGLISERSSQLGMDGSEASLVAGYQI